MVDEKVDERVAKKVDLMDICVVASMADQTADVKGIEWVDLMAVC
jgi:hypothetical protein